MRIAIPVSGGRLSAHFGHAETFAFIDTDGKSILATLTEEAPEHARGVLPPWLKDHGVEIVIAGGMGAGAQSLLHRLSIQVLTGAAEEEPEALVRQYLDGTLATGAGTCDHHGGGCHH